jgi:DNA-binding MarR family transcriptional regulator
MTRTTKKTAIDRASASQAAIEPAVGDMSSSSVVLDTTYLDGTIGYAIRRAQIAIFQDIYRAFGELSITTAQFSVLAVVADNPGANQSDLATALGVERPRMVPIIDALERRKLAVRVSSISDRRQRQIHLTQKGEQLLAELKSRFSQHQRRMIDRLRPSQPTSLLRDLWRLATVAQ